LSAPRAGVGAISLPKLEKAGVLDEINIDSFTFDPGAETIPTPFMIRRLFRRDTERDISR